MVRLLEELLYEAVLTFHPCVLLRNSKANVTVNSVLEALSFGS